MDQANDVGILIYDEVALSRHRTCLLLQGYDIALYEASSDIDLYNLLFNEIISIKLVLLDICSDTGKGIRILTRVKELKPELPVFVIMDSSKRQAFLRVLAEGANAIIQKPYTDDILLDKVFTILKKPRTRNHTIPSDFVFDIRHYLNRELKKAMKGSYEITIIMCCIIDIGNQSYTAIEPKHLEAVNNFYYTVRNNLWETDLFERYGAQTFIGMFPYCDCVHTDKLIGKLNDYFDLSVLNSSMYSTLRLAVSYITYPQVNGGPKELLLLLGTDMNDEIDNLRCIKLR